MPMFRFWGSDRGSDQTVAEDHTSVHHAKPHLQSSLTGATTPISSANVKPSKRRRTSVDDDEDGDALAQTKRLKSDLDSADDVLSPSLMADPMERARDEIRHQFGLEILLKHDELRLINQELAKCQTALEQLRRCHLIPYPVNCPTPDRMMEISAGKGPALEQVPGQAVPRWAPPFGVTDGPYARHYAKWLIPDASFDGMQPEWSSPVSEPTRSRNSFAEERMARSSLGESTGALKGRAGRGSVGQKLQALSSGYAQPKEKAGPCVLKRADGQTVKLVCLDCHRENFSSTQGFINHCRIAHKREFKSHEEAAVQSGHPIDASEHPTPAPAPVEEKPAPVVHATRTQAVHPFARNDMTEQEAYASLRLRIRESLKLYHQGQLPHTTDIQPATAKPRASHASTKADKVDASPEAPYLSRLMKSRKFNGSLRDLVADARTRISIEDITPEEDSDEDSHTSYMDRPSHGGQARAPVVMRMPAKSTSSPAPTRADGRPSSSKSHHGPHIDLASPESTPGSGPKDGSRGILSDDEMDMEDANLSPNTMVSNNAPSLVSDDGEYDDSDEGSSVSGASESLDDESMSDVAEITIDDDHEPRALRRDSTAVPRSMKMRKNDAKHVTFVSPVKGRPNKPQERKKRKI